MRGGRAGEEEEAAADTELKTKTPHVNVGKKYRHMTGLSAELQNPKCPSKENFRAKNDDKRESTSNTTA